MATIKDQLLDKRIVERNLQNGSLSKEQYEAYINTLKDVASNSERFAIADDENTDDYQA